MPSSALDPEHPISFSDRIFRFLDSGLTQTFLGIVGGLGGTFLDGRCYLAFMPFIPLAIHRNKVLEGVKRSHSTTVYLVSATVTLVFLYWLGASLNRSRPNTYTPRDYADAVTSILPKGQPAKDIAPTSKPREKSNVINPNDIEISACFWTKLKLNTAVLEPQKFDGPAECRVRITSNSEVMLKNALLRIYMIPAQVKIQTNPQSTMLPRDSGSEDEFYQIPISQTLLKGA